jgi:hypothetical protein
MLALNQYPPEDLHHPLMPVLFGQITYGYRNLVNNLTAAGILWLGGTKEQVS